MYNYLEEMISDVMDYVMDEIELNDFYGREDLESYLNDELFDCDSITGNASGSYTFNSSEAKEYVMDNIDLLTNVVYEGFLDRDTVGKKFLDEEWEYFDVTIRCYLLGQAISEALDRLDDDGKLVFDDDAEQECDRYGIQKCDCRRNWLGNVLV